MNLRHESGEDQSGDAVGQDGHREVDADAGPFHKPAHAAAGPAAIAAQRGAVRQTTRFLERSSHATTRLPAKENNAMPSSSGCLLPAKAAVAAPSAATPITSASRSQTNAARESA